MNELLTREVEETPVAERRPGLIRRAIENVWAKVLVLQMVGLTVLSRVSFAGAQEDPLTGTGGAIETVQDQIVGYAAPIGLALVAVGLAYVAVKLIPRVIRMIAARLG